jgi:hypothetical protein
MEVHAGSGYYRGQKPMGAPSRYAEGEGEAAETVREASARSSPSVMTSAEQACYGWTVCALGGVTLVAILTVTALAGWLVANM